MNKAHIDISREFCNMYDIADSGQCFRWYKITDGSVAFVFKSCTAIAVCNRETYSVYGWSERLSAYEIKKALSYYLDLETDYSRIAASVDMSDEYLKKASEEGKGIRILNQELWETIVSFMISQNNNIPRIRKSVADICMRFGEKAAVPDEAEDMLKKMNGGIWPEELRYTFPSAEEMDPEDLKGLGLGYREDYISELINKVNSGIFSINELAGIKDHEKAHELLMTIKGIGKKVSSCIELYGLHYKGAFPVDRWVRRIEEEHYNGHFPAEKYPETAGIMQQYMFFYERKTASGI